MDEKNILKWKNAIEDEIKKRNFDSLHYVLFDENKRLPWAFHLFYKEGRFMINGRDDRSYVMGNTVEFDDFNVAEKFFINKLEHFVESNRFKLKIGKRPYYSSPLWDKADA